MADILIWLFILPAVALNILGSAFLLTFLWEVYKEHQQ